MGDLGTCADTAQRTHTHQLVPRRAQTARRSGCRHTRAAISKEAAHCTAESEMAYSICTGAACMVCSRRHRAPRFLAGQSRSPSSQATWELCLHIAGAHGRFRGAAEQLAGQLPITGIVPATARWPCCSSGLAAWEGQQNWGGRACPAPENAFSCSQRLLEENEALKAKVWGSSPVS